MNIPVLTATVALLLGASAPPTPPPPAAEAVAPEVEQKFVPVAVQFHRVAPADASKSSGRKMQFNRRYAPLVLITRPDGTQAIGHGPTQEIELASPVETPQ